MTIRTKIIALLMAGVILPVLIVSIVIINQVRSDAKAQFEEESQDRDRLCG